MSDKWQSLHKFLSKVLSAVKYNKVTIKRSRLQCNLLYSGLKCNITQICLCLSDGKFQLWDSSSNIRAKVYVFKCRKCTVEPPCFCFIYKSAFIPNYPTIFLGDILSSYEINLSLWNIWLKEPQHKFLKVKAGYLVANWILDIIQ